MRIFYSIISGISLLTLFCQTALLSQTLSPDFSSAGFPKFSKNVFPAPFIYVEEHNGSHIILVEKRSQSLFLLNHVNGNIGLEKSYICSTGKQTGNKKETGDLKTPEGIYFSRSAIDSTDLQPLYGAGAFVLDYPNKFDLLSNKNGHGIWIHGTNEPERLKNSNDTKGCVVLKNEDLTDLAEYIKLNQTPVIIVNEIEYRNLEYVIKDREEILHFLKNWKKSWELKDLNTFIDCYSTRFRFNNMSLNSFRRYKNNLFNRYKWIKLDIDNIQIYKNGENALVNFNQKFLTDSYSDSGSKQLYLIKEQNEYKIIEEIWTELKTTEMAN